MYYMCINAAGDHSKFFDTFRYIGFYVFPGLLLFFLMPDDLKTIVITAQNFYSPFYL